MKYSIIAATLIASACAVAIPNDVTSGGATSAGTSGATSAGTSGATSAGTSGATSAGTSGATSAGTSGATSAGTSGATSAGTSGATSAGTSGATSGSTSGGTSGSTSGGTSGSTSGSTSGGTSGSTSGSTSGGTMGTTGRTSGGTSGSTTGRTSGSTTGKPTHGGNGGHDEYPVEYEHQEKEYEDKYFKPQDRECYEDKKRSGYKPHKPEPQGYDIEKSYYGELKFPKNIHKERPCSIDWKPKHYENEHEWKAEYKTKIYLVDCDDYEKPRKVCDEDCGEGHYDWHVPSDCESSDEKKPKWYRFKFVNYDDEESCTYSEEFPVYKKEYNVKPENDEVPVPECEECGAPPAPPAKDASPTGDESDSDKSPVGGEAPSYGNSNETAIYTGAASSAVRASLSVIVGVAALVTFAL